MKINMEIRAEILEYSLFIEKLVNELLLMNLGIYEDREKTKLFNNKGKLTFQNKIDLLFDISVLSKEENMEFELLMNIRNKFLHDLDCNSFQILTNQLDNGITNRFKKYLDDESVSDEAAYQKACNKLFKKNIETIKKKIETNKSLNKRKYKLYQLQNEQIIYYIDFIHEFLEKVSIATENSELENPKVMSLGLEIQKILEEAVDRLNSDNTKIDYNDFFESEDDLKSIFGIKKTPKNFLKWVDFKIEQPNKTLE